MRATEALPFFGPVPLEPDALLLVLGEGMSSDEYHDAWAKIVEALKGRLVVLLDSWAKPPPHGQG